MIWLWNDRILTHPLQLINWPFFRPFPKPQNALLGGKLIEELLAVVDRGEAGHGARLRTTGTASAPR